MPSSGTAKKAEMNSEGSNNDVMTHVSTRWGIVQDSACWERSRMNPSSPCYDGGRGGFAYPVRYIRINYQ
jgi:hypothetical protein